MQQAPGIELNQLAILAVGDHGRPSIGVETIIDSPFVAKAIPPCTDIALRILATLGAAGHHGKALLETAVAEHRVCGGLAFLWHEKHDSSEEERPGGAPSASGVEDHS